MLPAGIPQAGKADCLAASPIMLASLPWPAIAHGCRGVRLALASMNDINADAATNDGSAAGVLPSLSAVCDAVSRATETDSSIA